jgi:hypothetical protein
MVLTITLYVCVCNGCNGNMCIVPDGIGIVGRRREILYEEMSMYQLSILEKTISQRNHLT